MQRVVFFVVFLLISNAAAFASSDRDGDGIKDRLDNCPFKSNTKQSDRDSDTIGDACDNCPSTKNPDQADNDRDNSGDLCDKDDDNDGFEDDVDAFPFDATESRDSDGDGIGDNADSDRDGDGVANEDDAFPSDPTESSDRDGDGIGDNADTDNDNNGIPDEQEGDENDDSPNNGDNGDDNSDEEQEEEPGNDGDGSSNDETIDNDRDRDGFTNGFESALGTDPDSADSVPQRLSKVISLGSVKTLRIRNNSSQIRTFLARSYTSGGEISSTLASFSNLEINTSAEIGIDQDLSTLTVVVFHNGEAGDLSAEVVLVSNEGESSTAALKTAARSSSLAIPFFRINGSALVTIQNTGAQANIEAQVLDAEGSQVLSQTLLVEENGNITLSLPNDVMCGQVRLSSDGSILANLRISNDRKLGSPESSLITPSNRESSVSYRGLEGYGKSGGPLQVNKRAYLAIANLSDQDIDVHPSFTSKSGKAIKGIVRSSVKLGANETYCKKTRGSKIRKAQAFLFHNSGGGQNAIANIFIEENKKDSGGALLAGDLAPTENLDAVQRASYSYSKKDKTELRLLNIGDEVSKGEVRAYSTAGELLNIFTFSIASGKVARIKLKKVSKEEHSGYVEVHHYDTNPNSRILGRILSKSLIRDLIRDGSSDY